MKTIVVALMTLAVVIGSAKAATLENSEKDESIKSQMLRFFGYIVDYLQGGDKVKFPIKQVGKIVANNLPCLKLKPFFLNEYKRICGVKNCDKDAPICMDSLMPFELCELHKVCLPDALEAWTMGQSPKRALEDCVMMTIMEYKGLGYQEGAFDVNLEAIMRSVVNDSMLPEEVKAKVLNDAFGKCKLPTGDSCIMDTMRLKICLMNSCVDSMASLDE